MHTFFSFSCSLNCQGQPELRPRWSESAIYMQLTPHPKLPHSAPSWILSLAENLASSILQDGATEWYYSLDGKHKLRRRRLPKFVKNTLPP